jgi:transcriptional regulator with XRE-family HTH domain
MIVLNSSILVSYMNIGERIKELRVQLKMTQSNFVNAITLTYIQVGRYETQKLAPSSEVLQKLALALNTTSDYLLNGSQYAIVSAQLTDRELLNQFRAVEQLDTDDKKLVNTFIDAFITKRQIQKLAL